MFRSILVFSMTLFSGAALAQDLDYTYLQGSFEVVDIDNLNVDGEGVGLDASFALTNEFYLVGSYQGAGLDLDVDLTRWSAGAGFRAEIANNLDLIAEASYLYVEADAPGPGSADDNGLLGRVGIRTAISDAVELHGALRYDDISEEVGYDAGFLFNLTDNFAIGAFGLWEDEITTYRAGIRLSF